MRYWPFLSEFLYQLPCLWHVLSHTSGGTLIILLISSRPAQTTALPDLSFISRRMRSTLSSSSLFLDNQYICFIYFFCGLIGNRPFQFILNGLLDLLISLITLGTLDILIHPGPDLAYSHNTLIQASSII